jgi:SAM-dependent methyltransferase
MVDCRHVTQSPSLKAATGIGFGTQLESAVGVALRRAHLLELVFELTFVLDRIKNYPANQRFRREFPEFVVPPAALQFESQMTTNLYSFRNGGLAQARYIVATLEPYLPAGPLSICEWGCGPARLIRHFRDLDPQRWVDVHGCDYNARSIAWDQANLPDIKFATNNAGPPLPYPDNRFDVLYSSSVFTHIPGRLQRPWLAENLRVLKPGGLVMFTVHGDAFRGRFLPHELREYDQVGFVERGEVKPGWAWYTTYHNPRWVRQEFLKGLEIPVAHLASADGLLEHDFWVVRKPR